MGLMDKVKAQATQIAEKAQEAGKVGQAKLEGVQAKRKADSLLEDLGRITYEAHEGRGAAGGEQRAADLIEQLRQYEAEYGSVGGDFIPTAATRPAPTAGTGPVPTADTDPVPTSASAGDATASPSDHVPAAGSGGLPESNSLGDGEL